MAFQSRGMEEFKKVNGDSQTKESDLDAIKEWLKKQPHLPDTCDDRILRTFLRNCNFSLEKCKRKLDMYYTMRTVCSEFFTNRDITRPEQVRVTTIFQQATLPKLTPNGRRVTFTKRVVKDIKADDFKNAYKASLMLHDVRVLEELEGTAGDVFVLDGSTTSAADLAIISLADAKKFFICIQEAFPIKLKEVHVVNISPLIDAVLNFVKPLLKEKIRRRIFLHSNTSTLSEYIPIDMIPVEFGGNGESFCEMHNASVKKLETYTSWFKEQESLKSNEALRPGKPTNYDELFGIDGSFRQLCID